MDIYWIENKQRKGPVSVPDIIARIQMGELTLDTPGWHKGCSQWMPLKELPALADFVTVLEPSPQETLPTTPELPPFPHPQPEKPQTAEAFCIPPVPEALMASPKLILRLLARLTDYAIYTTLVMGIIYMLNIPFNQYLLFSNTFFWLPAILLEAYLLNKYGTTPGKKLMGIRIIFMITPARMPYRIALSRSFGVFILGMGCMLPLFIPIMMLIAAYMSRNNGRTLWDKRSFTQPVKQQSRPLIFLSIALLFICLHLCGIFLAPWLPDMIEQISQQDPQFGQWLQQKLPQQ